MIPFLIATTLTCQEAQGIIDNLDDVAISHKTELVQVIKMSTTEEGCWDAND